MASVTLRERVLAILPVIALAALAAGSYYLLQLSLPVSDDAPVKPKAHTPDSFANNFTVSMLSVTGITQYRLNAATMTHFEDDSSSTVTLPAIRAFSPGQPDVTSYSKRGTMNGDQSIIDLYDQARLLRDAGTGDPAMEADSEHFKIYVNDDVIETEKPVKLTRGLSVMYGDGMVYNNATRRMLLMGKVHGQIAASEPAATVPPK
jgi:lipopolysaccharide export system protein LptC